MEGVEHAVMNRESLKAVKRCLGIGKNQMYVLKASKATSSRI